MPFADSRKHIRYFSCADLPFLIKIQQIVYLQSIVLCDIGICFMKQNHRLTGNFLF